MGTAERRARQKASLRGEILDAARRMFAEEGYEQVSMRRLAERIEYSPTTIYLYFMRRMKTEPITFEGSSGQQAFDYLRRAVAACVDAGHFRPIDPEVAAQVLWMSVHGLVSLLVAKKGFPFATRAVLIDEQLETLLRGLLIA